MPEGLAGPAESGAFAQRRSVVWLLLGGALMLVVAVVSAGFTVVSINDSAAAVKHTLEVEAAINGLTAQGERIETARRGFLIQPDPAFTRTVAAANANFDRNFAALEALVSDNRDQLANIARIRAIGSERKAITDAMFADPAGAVAAARATNFDRDQGVLLIRELRAILDRMGAEEQRLLELRDARQQISLTRFYAVGALALALLVAMMAGAVYVVTRSNRDLTVAQGQLRIANEGLEDAVAARTTELSRANAEIQRFAYIVSHDLRSPLVNVLGFTSELDAARKTLHAHLGKLYEERPELKDQAAWLAVEEDLPEALGFIRASTEKMDRLINSILELSRQGRRTLTPERLDMDRLADSVAATMKQSADAAGATIALSPLPAVESDRMAVEQILSNLVENALKYLSPARAGEVRIEGRKNGAWVEIDVTDNGRGIAPADHERIFDLFRRAGAQDQAGEGIGLANVRALAYRLGGRVGVESQLDQGARFTLSLPEKFIAAEPSA